MLGERASAEVVEVAAIERFRSEQLVVREVVGFSRDVLVVTFDGYTNTYDLERPGFAETFLRDRRIDAIHVINCDNRWYQYAELPQALAVVAEIASLYRRVVAYGSSMGAYAAIRFGGAAGALEALALSPQFSVDPKIVPFEQRWVADAARIDYLIERNWRKSFVSTAYIAYDPHDIDSRHAALFAARTRVVPVALPHSGHPCAGFIYDVGLLQPAVLALARGDFDPAELRRAARQRRSQSPEFFGMLARRGRYLPRREAAARRAIELGPGIPHLHVALAQVLGGQGRLEEARQQFACALEIIPEDPPTLYSLADMFVGLHHWERATDIVRTLADRQPHVPLYPFRLARLETRLGAERQRRRVPRPLRKRSLLARWAAFWQAPETRDRAPSQCVSSAGYDTVTPAPPPSLASLKRHENLLRRLPVRRLHLLLVGDSLMHFWPESCWAGLRVFNFGIAADQTQHVLWRLRRLRPYRLDPAMAVVMVGTNNLSAGDPPEAIAAGVAAIVAELHRVVPDADCLVIGVPPCGDGFTFNRDARLAANQILRANPLLRYVDIDEIVTTGFSPDCRNYETDMIHFSEEGYRVLTRFLLPLISAPARSAGRLGRFRLPSFLPTVTIS